MKDQPWSQDHAKGLKKRTQGKEISCSLKIANEISSIVHWEHETLFIDTDSTTLQSNLRLVSDSEGSARLDLRLAVAFPVVPVVLGS